MKTICNMKLAENFISGIQNEQYLTLTGHKRDILDRPGLFFYQNLIKIVNFEAIKYKILSSKLSYVFQHIK